VCLSYLGADVFEFQEYRVFNGKGGPSSYWDRRYRYTFKDGLLASIETSYAVYLTDKIAEQNTVTIKRYKDRLEAYKNGKLHLTVYYVNSNTMYYVMENSPAIKRLVIMNNYDIIVYLNKDEWHLKITKGENTVFRFNGDNEYPLIDFIVTEQYPSTVWYDKSLCPSEYIYEKTGTWEYEWVTYRDGIWREAETKYVIIPPTGKYSFSVADFLVDYICGEPFEPLFWGQFITRSENCLSVLHE